MKRYRMVSGDGETWSIEEQRRNFFGVKKWVKCLTMARTYEEVLDSMRFRNTAPGDPYPPSISGQRHVDVSFNAYDAYAASVDKQKTRVFFDELLLKTQLMCCD